MSYDWLEEQLLTGKICYDAQIDQYYTPALNTITGLKDRILLHPNDQERLRQLKDAGYLKFTQKGKTGRCAVRMKT